MKIFQSRKGYLVIAFAFFLFTICIGTSVWASPITIGFDGVPSTPGVFVGPITENGFVYSSVGEADGLFSSPNYGNPNPEMQATALYTSYYSGNDAGILQLVGSTSGQSFQFLGMDIAQREISTSATHTITVEGFLQGSLVGIEYFITPKSDQGSNNSPYITVNPNAQLLNTTIDQLLIHMPGQNDDLNNGIPYYFTRVDNIQLNPAPVPEPATIFLVGTGLAGLAGIRTRRKKI